jgi:hypothetical protein
VTDFARHLFILQAASYVFKRSVQRTAVQSTPAGAVVSMGTSKSVLILLFGCLACQLVAADHRNHIYKQGEHVVLYANKVGPFHNPR